MKITDRDKKILYIFCSLLLVFCAYYFGYNRLNDTNLKLDSEISKLDTEYSALKVMSANEKDYAQKTETYTTEYDSLLASYDSGYSQEYSIMFLKEIEDHTGVWVKQTSFTETKEIYGFGEVKSSNPSISGQQVYSTDHMGYQTTLSLTYESSYANLIQLIDYINTYRYKCTIDFVTMSYNADSDTVTGDLVLSQYAIVGTDRPFTGAYISDLLNGTDNIFHSSVFSGGVSSDVTDGNNILSDYDYYVTLQPSTSDVDALVIGAKDDSQGEQTLSTNSNSFEDVTIRVTGTNGTYAIQYQIGNLTYPAQNYDGGHEFLPGEMLSFLVISAPRTGVEDLSGAHVKLINETDMALYVKIVNEDTDSPRFVIDDKQGDITIYE